MVGGFASLHLLCRLGDRDDLLRPGEGDRLSLWRCERLLLCSRWGDLLRFLEGLLKVMSIIIIVIVFACFNVRMLLIPSVNGNLSSDDTFSCLPLLLAVPLVLGLRCHFVQCVFLHAFPPALRALPVGPHSPDRLPWC